MRPKNTSIVKNTTGSKTAPAADQGSRKKPGDAVNSDIKGNSALNKEQITKNILNVNSELEKDSDESVTVFKSTGQKISCRLCDKDITGKECHLLYDGEENVETRLGRKINIIINSTETQLNLSQYCCSVCTSKIEVCFSLLVEIQASDEVIKQTYGHLANGVPLDTSTQLFICGECKSTITGIKSFIRHYENHILKKTVINSRSDIKVSQSIPNTRDSDDTDSSDIKKIFKFNGKRKGSDNEEEEHDVASEQLHRSENNVRKKGSKRPNFEKVKLNAELYDDKNTVDENLCRTESENDAEMLEASDHELEGDGAESLDKEAEEEISESELSVSSDSSYKKLVSIVKAELERSDSDDDSNVVITINEDGNYYCAPCDRPFEYKFMLAYHVMKDHKWNGFAEESSSEVLKAELEEDGYINCTRCQDLVLSSEYDKHMEECSGEFTGSDIVLCDACGKICSQKQWPNHTKRHMSHAGMWGCEICGKRFKAKRILRSHLGEHDESKKKVCEICGKKLLPLSFFSHMMKHKEKRHVCQFCGKGFTYNYGLRIHSKVHEGSERLETKNIKKRDKLFCWMCKKEFETSTALHKHLKNQHNIEGIELDSRFSCSECDKKFADMFGLKAHLKLIHEMKDEEISRFKSLPVYRFIECNVCNQVFNSENKVRIHMKQDHGLKPFEMEILKKECEKCGKRFASKQNLIHHINGAHLNIKPMQCDVCNERFAKHSSLIYHKLRHSGEKPFQCEFCHRAYRQRNDVIRHLARHVRDQELTLEEASAINNSPSPLVLKRRIFLKDSSISSQALVSKNRRQKTEVVEVDPAPVIETKIEYDEGSMIYVEEVMADEFQQPESPTEVKYMTVKPVYSEERNTIILSSPELFRNTVDNVSYRYVLPQGKDDLPIEVVKKEIEM